jgi:hypothetical protein
MARFWTTSLALKWQPLFRLLSSKKICRLGSPRPREYFTVKIKKDALILAKAAHALAPDDYKIRMMTDWLNQHEAPLWHFGIIHDQERNKAYEKALNHFVKPGMTVFEIGTEILAMLAVRAGAEHVYTCERRADVAEAAKAIIERNGMSDRITVIAKDA